MLRILSDGEKPAALDEFKVLRAEILLRLQLRSRLLTLAFTLFGVVGSLALNETLPAEALFLFPIISCFIALEWSYHDNRIYATAAYIKEQLEPNLTGLNWQHHLDETRQGRKLRVTAWAAGGIFICASILSTALTLSSWDELYAQYRNWIWAFYAMNAVALAVSIWAIALRKVHLSGHKRRVIE